MIAYLYEFGDRERMGMSGESLMLPPEIRYATIVARCVRAGWEEER